MSRRTRAIIHIAEVLLKSQTVIVQLKLLSIRDQEAKQAHEKHAKRLPELVIGEPLGLHPRKSQQFLRLDKI